MTTYCIGDVQGCDSDLQRLLDTVGYSPSRDCVYLVGDLVNRGPQSRQVIERCMRDEGSLFALLGNHDLHLIARAYGSRKGGKRDTLDDILHAPDCHTLIDWLRQQPLMRLAHIGAEPLAMVHAGLLPQWTVEQAMALAEEVHAMLRSDECDAFMQHMYGNKPDHWRDDLQGYDRLRAIINALSRLRFCTPKGRMDFESSESAEKAPKGLLPWFEAPHRASADTPIVFGHWSTLGLQDRNNIIALDTGCVWGGQLTAVRFGATVQDHEFIHVKCAGAQKPG